MAKQVPLEQLIRAAREQNAKNERPCTFTFDHITNFEGFTDDTRWNGFLNVRVTPETHAQVREWLGEDDWNECGFGEIAPDADGLYSYAGGFATEEA